LSDQPKKIAILGSTGSIGTQAIDVINQHPSKFKVLALTAGNNAGLLIEQAIALQPSQVCIANEAKYDEVKNGLSHLNIEVSSGKNAINEIAANEDLDMLLSSLVGFAGLEPTITAIKKGTNIALANKETLVVAGQLINDLLKQHQVKMYPVDSEHSAIFQCLIGEENNPIEKIYLTASGGPFRGKDKSFLETVKKEQALKHPNWEMGAKITIDSATLMNKGLEVIEAKWLFDLQVDQIDVIVHPQSIIHSIVQYEDGSMKAQMGLPDMKLPIQYALAYPNRIQSNFPRFNFIDYPQLTFEQPDKATFRCLGLAFTALEKGGNMPCILNAANEIAVASFLKDEISFLKIPSVIEKTMTKVEFIANPSIEDLIQTDLTSREICKSL